MGNHVRPPEVTNLDMAMGMGGNARSSQGRDGEQRYGGGSVVAAATKPNNNNNNPATMPVTMVAEVNGIVLVVAVAVLFALHATQADCHPHLAEEVLMPTAALAEVDVTTEVDWEMVDANEGTKPQQLYRKEAVCPYSKWFAQVPKKMSLWENVMKTAFEDAFKKANVKPDIALNDHNYNTQLGQGNTLAFLEGVIRIDPRRLPKAARVSIFQKPGEFPAILRFSDFGADGQLQLGRLAVKFPNPASWNHETNWLFTETLPVFPLANFDGVNEFVGDPEDDAGFLDKLGVLWDSKSTIWHVPAVLEEKDNGQLFSKTYYSQLPYAIGEKYAMKFRLVPHPVKPKLPELNRERETFRRFAEKHLVKDPVTFDLEVQLHAGHDDDLVQTQAAKEWDEDWFNVGVLHINMQRTFGGYNEALMKRVLQATGNGGGNHFDAHKFLMFHPVMTDHALRPLGQVQAFRGDFYSKHALSRTQTMQKDLFKLTTEDKIVADELFGDDVVSRVEKTLKNIDLHQSEKESWPCFRYQGDITKFYRPAVGECERTSTLMTCSYDREQMTSTCQSVKGHNKCFGECVCDTTRINECKCMDVVEPSHWALCSSVTEM